MNSLLQQNWIVEEGIVINVVISKLLIITYLTFSNALPGCHSLLTQFSVSILSNLKLFSIVSEFKFFIEFFFTTRDLRKTNPLILKAVVISLQAPSLIVSFVTYGEMLFQLLLTETSRGTIRVISNPFVYNGF